MSQLTLRESQSRRLSVWEPVLLLRLSPWSLASLVSVDITEVTVLMGGAGGGTPGLTML